MVARRKVKRFDRRTEVRRLARERVGNVPSAKVMVPKTRRKKPKHKKAVGAEDVE